MTIKQIIKFLEHRIEAKGGNYTGFTEALSIIRRWQLEGCELSLMGTELIAHKPDGRTATMTFSHYADEIERFSVPEKGEFEYSDVYLDNGHCYRINMTSPLCRYTIKKGFFYKGIKKLGRIVAVTEAF